MWGFRKKRFFITLGLSILIWYVTVVIQGVIGFNAPFNIPFSGSTCKVTGFPIPTCLYGREVWFVNLINVLFWFWVVHLFWNWFEKSRN